MFYVQDPKWALLQCLLQLACLLGIWFFAWIVYHVWTNKERKQKKECE